MPTFLVERYAPSAGVDAALDAVVPGTVDGKSGVRLLLSVTVPADEIALGLFEAPSGDAVARLLEARSVAYIRIVEALLRTPAVDASRAPGAVRSTAPHPAARGSIQGGMA